MRYFSSEELKSNKGATKKIGPFIFSNEIEDKWNKIKAKRRSVRAEKREQKEPIVPTEFT